MGARGQGRATGLYKKSWLGIMRLLPLAVRIPWISNSTNPCSRRRPLPCKALHLPQSLLFALPNLTLQLFAPRWPRGLPEAQGLAQKTASTVPVLAVRSAATSLGCEGLAHSLLDLFVQLLDEPATQGSNSHMSAALTRSSIKTSRIDLSFPARWACSRRFCICASQVGVSLRSNTCTSEIS